MSIAGVLVIELAPGSLPYGLPVSAGVALYVGASDLVPEVNREPGVGMALVVFLGVGILFLLDTLIARTFLIPALVFFFTRGRQPMAPAPVGANIQRGQA